MLIVLQNSTEKEDVRYLRHIEQAISKRYIENAEEANLCIVIPGAELGSIIFNDCVAWWVTLAGVALSE